MKTFTIVKLVEFCASHQLKRLPEGHKCAREHGHNYEVRVCLKTSELDENGFVLDFGIVSDLIKNRYDHQNLNEVMKTDLTTAEMLALDIAEEVKEKIAELRPAQWNRPRVVYVEVKETHTSAAIVDMEE